MIFADNLFASGYIFIEPVYTVVVLPIWLSPKRLVRIRHCSCMYEIMLIISLNAFILFQV